MKVTDVRIRVLNPEGRMKAVASVIFDAEFVVHDVRIVEGHLGLFVAMPSRKTPEGEFRDIVHPITTKFRDYVQKEVLKVYRKADILAAEPMVDLQDEQ